MRVVSRQIMAIISLLIVIAAVFAPQNVKANTASASTFTLVSSPARVIQGLTFNVQVTCMRNSTVRSNLKEIKSLRIEKLTGYDMWWTVAQVRYDYAGVDAIDQVNARGWVEPTKLEAFLEITWPVANEKTFGFYRCDVFGLDENLYHEQETTSEIEIQKQIITGADMFNFITQMKHEMETKIFANADRLQAIKINKESNVDSDLSDDFIKTDTLVVWPTGYYGLPQPKSGCPVDFAFYGGDTGYVRFEIESVFGEYFHQSHLAGPLIDKPEETTFFSIHYCVVTRVFNTAQWPDGKYCIHQKGDVCPDTFRSVDDMTGYFDVVNRNYSIYGGALPEVNPNLFCCKDTASPDEPMVLPTDQPFYLYLFGDSCQKVQNMDVRREDILIQPMKADVQISLGLCYYVQQ